YLPRRRVSARRKPDLSRVTRARSAVQSVPPLARASSCSRTFSPAKPSPLRFDGRSAPRPSGFECRRILRRPISHSYLLKSLPQRSAVNLATAVLWQSLEAHPTRGQHITRQRATESHAQRGRVAVEVWKRRVGAANSGALESAGVDRDDDAFPQEAE